MENGAIPFGSLNRCPLFWPKVHRFGHLSLEGGTRNRTRVRNPSQIVTPLWPLDTRSPPLQELPTTTDRL